MTKSLASIIGAHLQNLRICRCSSYVRNDRILELTIGKRNSCRIKKVVQASFCRRVQRPSTITNKCVLRNCSRKVIQIIFTILHQNTCGIEITICLIIVEHRLLLNHKSLILFHGNVYSCFKSSKVINGYRLGIILLNIHRMALCICSFTP